MDERLLGLYQLIFEFLDLYDLRSMRCVCKRLRAAVSDYQIRELSFTLGESKKFNWFHTNRPADFLCNLHGYEFYPLTTRAPLFGFRWLRKLKIDFNESSGFSFNGLASLQLDQLEQLELTYLPTGGSNAKNHQFRFGHHLSFANLKVFSIKNYRPAHLVLDTPSLVAFDNDSGFPQPASDYLEFKHPRSVRFLSVYQLDDYLAGVLSNVCQLEISQASFVALNLLSKFDHLEVLRMRCLVSEDQDLVAKLRELMSCEKRQRHLKIYSLGMRLDEYNLDYGHSSAFSRTNLERLIYNYARLDDHLDWINTVNYNDLMNLTNGSRSVGLD